MISGAKLTSVKAIRAHVRNGQIVPDEPVDLPEGALVEVMVMRTDDVLTPEEAGPNSIDPELTPDELEELEREIELSQQEIARGEYVDGIEFARKLAARR